MLRHPVASGVFPCLVFSLLDVLLVHVTSYPATRGRLSRAQMESLHPRGAASRLGSRDRKDADGGDDETLEGQDEMLEGNDVPAVLCQRDKTWGNESARTQSVEEPTDGDGVACDYENVGRNDWGTGAVSTRPFSWM